MGQYITLIPNIAWRNIWRNKGRSFLVIGAVAIGIWTLIFLMGFVRGLVYGYIANAIQNETSHLQIHNPDFQEEREIQYVIPGAPEVIGRVRNLAETQHVSGRLLVNAMVSTAHGARGLQLTGVNPEDEAAITHISKRMISGSFFTEDGKNEIVLSRTVAEKLSTDLRKKIIITFQNSDLQISTAALRVAGIFDSHNKKIDETTAYVRTTDLLPLTGLPEGSAHEIAILLNAIDSTDSVQKALSAEFPDLRVETYRELSPDLDLFNSQIRLNMIIMTTIIMLALIFGIINTMLMAVLERMREIGMLMAIGMTRIRVFMMIVWETVFVACIGAPIGMLLGYITIRILGHTGIDLSMWSAGLSQFGLATKIFPVIEGEIYVFIAISITVTALLASIYPSIKAIRLRPVEALRKI